MNLETTYLGLRLPCPLMPGASPLVDDLDTVRRLEDAGAAAIVMHSLFEEQMALEALAGVHVMDRHANGEGEAIPYFPESAEFRLAPDAYLEQLNRIKSCVGVPVIASLNGSTPGGWLHFAHLMQETGADALELNVYRMPTSLEEDGRAIERETVEMVRSIREQVSIPIAVKLSPFYTALSHFAMQLDLVGVDGLVLFNRFYQPDIDVETMEVRRTLDYSDSSELRLRLRWVAALSGTLDASLAVTGGVHSALDVVKSMMCGAHAVQMVSGLMQHGPEHLAVVRRELVEWLERHEYESLALLQGSMSLRRCANPGAFERANYVQMLQGDDA